MNKYFGCTDEQILLLDKAIEFDEINDVVQAKKYYLEVLKLGNHVPYAYSMLGGIEYDNKNYKEAIKYFNKALELYPEAFNTIKLRAEAKEMLGLLKEAITDYDLLISLNPNYSDAYLNKGMIFEYKGNYLYALKLYKNALFLEPENSFYRKKIKKIKWLIKQKKE